MARLTDIRKTALADLARFPGTVDKDRYARNIRQEVMILQAVNSDQDDALSELWDLTLTALRRWITRSDPLEVSQRKLVVALDCMVVMAPGEVQWRTIPEDIDGTPLVKPLALRYGHSAADARDYGHCVCAEDDPEVKCYATVHDA